MAADNAAAPETSGKKAFPLLALGALGIVFGDIGTSPLYTLQSCFFGSFPAALTPDNILGITSALVWSLVLVVSCKYVLAVMRADHRGEGGILALTTLADNRSDAQGKRMMFPILGIVGAALLYSDGIITPAISVLSAVEGLNSVTASLAPFVLPLSLAVLALLFIIQRKGTGSIGVLFGPVMLLWFLVLGILGGAEIVRQPAILYAFNPGYAAGFFRHNGPSAFFLLGSVFLAVTGAEVLYADIGHFGKRPIRFAWWFLVFPALLLNYFGQSALLLNGEPIRVQLYYSLCPKFLLIPLIFLATIATVIASQAVISGMFSLGRQAVQLDYWPRMNQVHTSAHEAGQVYIPFVNFMLFVGTLFLVLFFEKSERLASAYGIAVSATMLITTGLILYVSWTRWKNGRLIAILMGCVFIPLDAGFFLANAAKIASGGWIVIVVSSGLIAVMLTWRNGRRILGRNAASQSLSLDLFMQSLENDKPLRVPGVAVFLTGNSRGTPRSILHNFKHNKVIHETVIFVTVIFEEAPKVPKEDQVVYRYLGAGIHRVELHYGFFENADIPAALQEIVFSGVTFKPMQATFFLGRETLILARNGEMASWRKKMFRFLSTNARSASEYFNLPVNRVVEIGLQVEM